MIGNRFRPAGRRSGLLAVLLLVALSAASASAAMVEVDVVSDARGTLPLYRAVHDYRGQQLCGRYLDHIRVLLESFDPAPPPPSGGDGGPTVDFCGIHEVIFGLCGDWEPPVRVDIWPPRKYVDPSRVDPRQLRELHLTVKA